MSDPNLVAEVNLNEEINLKKLNRLQKDTFFVILTVVFFGGVKIYFIEGFV